MTVSAIEPEVILAGDGLNKVFTFNFPMGPSSSVRVQFVDDTLTPQLVDPTEYSLTNNSQGGTVTFNDAPPLGLRVAITRDTTIDQQVAVTAQTSYDPKVVEGVWDKLTLHAQEARKALETVVHGPPGSNPADTYNVLIQAKEDAEMAADNAANWRDEAKAWAESPGEPGDPGTKSAKTWADEARQDRIQTGQACTAARNAKQAAEAARDKAQDWAEGAGTPGGAGTKSAKSWAAASAASAQSIVGDAQRAEDARDAAEGYRDDAQAARDKAQDWAEDAGEPGGPGTASAKSWASEAGNSAAAAAQTKANLLDDLTVEAASLPATDSATAVWDGPNQKLTLGVPRGPVGAAGAPGVDAETARDLAAWTLPSALSPRFWRASGTGAPSEKTSWPGDITDAGAFLTLSGAASRYITTQMAHPVDGQRLWDLTITLRTSGPVTLIGTLVGLGDDYSSRTPHPSEVVAPDATGDWETITVRLNSGDLAAGATQYRFGIRLNTGSSPIDIRSIQIRDVTTLRAVEDVAVGTVGYRDLSDILAITDTLTPGQVITSQGSEYTFTVVANNDPNYQHVTAGGDRLRLRVIGTAISTGAFGHGASGGDQSGPIQAALDFAAENGLGTVLLSRGAQLANTVEIPGGVTLTSPLRRKVTMLAGCRTAFKNRITGDVPEDGPGLENIIIDANNVSDAYEGFRSDGSKDVRIRGCEFLNFTAAATGSAGAGHAGADGNDPVYAGWDNACAVVLTSHPRPSGSMYNSSRWLIDDCRFINCRRAVLCTTHPDNQGKTGGRAGDGAGFGMLSNIVHEKAGAGDFAVDIRFGEQCMLMNGRYQTPEQDCRGLIHLGDTVATVISVGADGKMAGGYILFTEFPASATSNVITSIKVDGTEIMTPISYLPADTPMTFANRLKNNINNMGTQYTARVSSMRPEVWLYRNGVKLDTAEDQITITTSLTGVYASGPQTSNANVTYTKSNTTNVKDKWGNLMGHAGSDCLGILITDNGGAEMINATGNGAAHRVWFAQDINNLLLGGATANSRTSHIRQGASMTRFGSRPRFEAGLQLTGDDGKDYALKVDGSGNLVAVGL